MLIWVILTAMTSFAAVWVAAPLLRRYDEAAIARANDLEVYKDQLFEVDRELALGQIDRAQADAAALEIKRRLLGVEQATGSGYRFPTPGQRHLGVAVVAGTIVIGSTVLYSNLGRPDLPSVARPATELVLGSGGHTTSFRAAGGRSAQAGAARNSTGPQAAVNQASSAEAESSPSGTQRAGSLDEMIQRLVERAKKEPGKAETWRMLGWSYASVERFGEAATAYGKAIALEPNNASLHAARAEALMSADDGKIQGETRSAIHAALAIDPKEPRARFMKGLALIEAGDKPGGLELWLAVLPEFDPRDPAAADLRARSIELARELNVDISARLPAGTGEATDGATAGGFTSAAPLQLLKDGTTSAVKGPTVADVKAAETMSPSDRNAMIRGMVDKLAARLDASPRDADGWIQLMRSRRVLSDMEGARGAMVKAVAAFSDAPDELTRIKAAAAELGISQ